MKCRGPQCIFERFRKKKKRKKDEQKREKQASKYGEALAMAAGPQVLGVLFSPPVCIVYTVRYTTRHGDTEETSVSIFMRRGRPAG